MLFVIDRALFLFAFSPYLPTDKRP